LEKLSFSLFITQKALMHVLESNRPICEKVGLIGYLVEASAQSFLDPHKVSTKNNHLSSAKAYGYFFTPISLALKMAGLGLRDIDAKIILDPACGTGTLLAAALIYNPKIDHVIGIEIDEKTAHYAQCILESISKELGVTPKIDIRVGDFLNQVDALEAVSDVRKPDLLIMNPPYGRVRILASEFTDKQTKVGLGTTDLAKLHDGLRQGKINVANSIRRRFAPLGLGKGTPEFSTLFLAAATKVVKSNGRIVAISPTSWLGDGNCKGLREYMFTNHGIEEVWHFHETAKLFRGVNQPTSVISIRVDAPSKKIRILPDLLKVCDTDKKPEILDENKIREFSPDWLRVPRRGNSRAELLKKLHALKPLGDNSNCLNLRGEFDLTANKDLIRRHPTEYRLIRGDHIERFRLKEQCESIKEGFVDAKSFKARLGKSPKLEHIGKYRIAIPQSSYMLKKRRIEACIVPPNHIIANSCNYITLSCRKKNDLTSSPSDELLVYCSFLNSAVLEWRFRLFNSNNHVANYEIDEMPLPDLTRAKQSLINKLINYNDSSTDSKIGDAEMEALIAIAYGLSLDEMALVLSDIKYENQELVLAKMKESIKDLYAPTS
jgi:Alw26I/Eco31I/Esp3I family type II restriction m6 adenine DNA methyltransferase